MMETQDQEVAESTSHIWDNFNMKKKKNNGF